MKLIHDASLLPYNTFGVDARAKFLVEIKHEDYYTAGIVAAKEHGLPILIVGSGSNMLFVSNYIRQALIVVRTQGMDIITREPEFTLVQAAAGHNWREFALWTVESGLGGLENLAHIPGTVGAAPVQNVGAYGVEAKDTIWEVEAIDMNTLETRIFRNEECAFGYRNSVFKNRFKGKYLVKNVVFKLDNPGYHRINDSYGNIREQLDRMGITRPLITDVAAAVTAIRRDKLPDPAEIGSAGSFFKNPVVDSSLYEQLAARHAKVPHYPLENGQVKIPAGWLIEQAGWKGFREGDAGVYPKQALILVNYGKATGRQIHDLCRKIQDDVLDKFGIGISPEVNIIEG